MDIEKVYEFDTGKNEWNTMEVGVKDGNIVVRDDVGMIEFEEDAVDELVNGIDQARRRLREKQRRPTANNSGQDEEETASEADDTEMEREDESDDEPEEPESTGLGPQFPGSDPSM